MPKTQQDARTYCLITIFLLEKSQMFSAVMKQKIILRKQLINHKNCADLINFYMQGLLKEQQRIIFQFQVINIIKIIMILRHNFAYNILNILLQFISQDRAINEKFGEYTTLLKNDVITPSMKQTLRDQQRQVIIDWNIQNHFNK
ncbi:hypothetical protein pb186bvf_003156 [Paramecium bursaria]